MKFSQFEEEQVIAEYFKDYKGMFIDIGAGNGITLSNTFRLLINGWKGMLVEPNPFHFSNLVMNTAYFGSVKLVNAAVWHQKTVLEFHLDNTWFSGLQKQDHKYLASYWVPTVTPEDLAKIEGNCDLMSIDAEGADTLIFPALMDAYRFCKMVVVEHGKSTARKLDWKELFNKHRYEILKETEENYVAIQK